MSVSTLSQFARSNRSYKFHSYKDHWIRCVGLDPEKDKIDPAFIAIGNLQERICNLWDGIADVDKNRNPLQTTVQHKQNIQDSALKGIAQINKSKGTTYKAVQRRINEIGEEMNDRLGIKNSDNLKEIRQVLREMTPKERNQALNNAVRDADGELLSALVYGHPVASGLKSMKDIERYIDAAKDIHCKDLKDQQQVLADAVTFVEDALKSSERFAMAVGPTPLDKKKIEAAQAAAMRLNRNIDEILQEPGKF